MKPLDLYSQWKANPGPKTLTPVITALGPTIQKSLASHGFDRDANMQAAAQLHLTKRLPHYDPEKSALPTWATNELKRMPRIGHKQRHGVPMPERAAIDLSTIRTMEKDLCHRLGREPTADELADETGLSTRRIGSLRARFGVPTVTEGMTTNQEGLEATLASSNPTYERLALQLIYDESAPVDKQIMDYMFGWHGQPKLPKNEIAKRLKRSPANITQRASVLARKIEDLELAAIL